MYFLLWHILIYFRYKNFIKKEKFDFIHHVTFATFRIPNLLCLSGPPFIYGPLAGGEIVPFKLFKEFTVKSKLIEAVRYISNLYIQFSLLINITFFKSKKIILTSQIIITSVLFLNYYQVKKKLNRI